MATSLNDIFFLFDEQPASAAFTVISLSVACVHNINTSGSTPECERCKQCGLFDSFYFSFDKFKWRFLSFFFQFIYLFYYYFFLQIAGKHVSHYFRSSSFVLFIFVQIPGCSTHASNIFLRHKYQGLGFLRCMSANGDGLTTTTTKGLSCRLLRCLVVSKSQGLGMRRPAVAPIHSHDKRESRCRH